MLLAGSRAFVAVALACAIAPTAGAASPNIEFPHTVELGASQRLFVEGHEFAKRLMFTYESDTLWINNHPVLPPPPDRPPPCLPDSIYFRFRGHIPSFRECIALGGSACECDRAYSQKEHAMLAKIRQIYQDECAKGGLDAAAESALTALDPDVVGPLDDPLKSFEISPSGVLMYHIPGDVQAMIADLGAKEPERPPVRELTPAEGSADLTQRVATRFARADKPVIVFVVRGQVALSASGTAAVRILAEVDSIRANPNFETKSLPGGFAKLILDPR